LEEGSHLRVTQNGRLREIPGDMSLGESYLLCLKMQRDLPNLLTISLQPLFSKFSAICRKTFSNRVAGGSIKSYHTKRIPGQVMPNFCTLGQDMLC
jgi:hypothetical protein